MDKYIGWIPSIIGNLSYSLAGYSNYPQTPKLCIFEYSGSYHYIISQTRISHDFQLGLATLIPFKKWAKKFEAFMLERRGLYSIWVPILIGTCSHESSELITKNIVGKNFQTLGGKVFFIPKIPETTKLLTILVKSINNMECCLSNKKSEFSPKKAFKAKLELESCLENILQAKDRTFSLFTCDFELQRNGICTLSGLEIIEYDTNVSSDFDKGEHATDEQAYNQVFYFLKDIFHKHKFHSPDYDTLTQVYKLDKDNERGWAIETLKNFYRSAIHFSPEDSLGIIYYARALKEIINNDSQEEENNDNFSFLAEKSISDAHAENLCKSRIDTKKKIVDSKKWIAGLFGGGLLVTWSRAYEGIFTFLNISNETNILAIHFMVPLLIAWSVLIYVEKEHFSLSKFPQVIKLIKYLTSIPIPLQLITLFSIFIAGSVLLCISFLLQ